MATGTTPQLYSIVVFEPGVAGAHATLGHVGFVIGVYSPTRFRMRAMNDSAGFGNYSERDVNVVSGVSFIYHGSAPTQGEGSFVQVSGSAAIYRIAGGAPLYVSNWNNVGGSQPYSVISQAQFNALRAVPADGTFIAAGGHVYRIAGGAPLYVSTWNAFGGAKSCVTVDGWVIANITNPAAHLNARPSNGTLISSTATGRVYIMAGGAPIYVSSWAAIGGSRASVGIDQWDLDNITNPMAHLNARPSNGTCISSSADGRCYVIAGGAPIYISNWAAIGGAKPASASTSGRSTTGRTPTRTSTPIRLTAPS